MYEAAQIFTSNEILRLLGACEETRYPIRNRAMVLLATDAGLAPGEIALARRWNVLGEDNLLAEEIDLISRPRKYLAPRRIPMPREGRLWRAVGNLLENAPALPHDPLMISERAREGGHATAEPGSSRLAPMRATSIGYVFWKLCERAGIALEGGRAARNTFIVTAGRRMKDAGASVRDVQILAGHRSLSTTQRYLEADLEAQKRLLTDLFGLQAAE